MSQEVTKWLVNGLFNLLVNGIFLRVISYNPLILTFYQHFQRDIQVVLGGLIFHFHVATRKSGGTPKQPGLMSTLTHPKNPSYVSQGVKFSCVLRPFKRGVINGGSGVLIGGGDGFLGHYGSMRHG